MGLKNSVISTLLSVIFVMFGTLISAQNITIEQSGSPFLEDGGTATVTVRTDEVFPEDITVELAFSGTATYNADYSTDPPTQRPVLIPAGSETGTILITAINDEIYEGNETITIEIISVSDDDAEIESPSSVTLEITDDETPPTVSLSAEPLSFSENGGSSTITVSMSSPASEEVTVDLTVNHITASPADHDFSNTQVVFEPGDTEQEIIINGVDDQIFEGTETLTLQLGNINGAGATIGTQSSVTLEITDDESAPTVSLSASTNTFAENESSSITASLNRASSQDVTITLEINDQTTQPEDYSLSGHPIIIPAGSLSASATISGEEDNFYEGDETLEITISEASGGVNIGDNQPILLTITDNQTAPVVSLNISPTSIMENGSSTITAALSTPTFEDVTVALATSAAANGAIRDVDYSLSAPSIVIPAFSSSATVTINAIDDNIYEGNETFTVSIQSISGGAATEDGTQEITVIIIDNDNAPEVTLSATPESIPEDGFSTLTVSLSNPTTENVLVNLETNSNNADANDYILTSTSITIPPGETEGSTTLEAIPDNIFEGDEQVTVSISGVGGGNASEDGNQEVTINIEDAQTMPSVSLNFTGTPFSENGGIASLNIELSHASYQPVTVELNFGGTASSSDYSGAQEQVTIPAGSLSQSLTITGIDDLEAEGDETIVVTIVSVTNALEDGTQSVSATILDDDIPGIKPTIFDSGNITSEDGTQDAFTVELNTRPTSPVVIEITGLDTSEGILSTQSLTFTPGNWDQAQIITITGVDDDEVDGDITYTLTLSVVDERSDAAYHGESVEVIVTNRDNDSAGFELNITNSHTQTNESGSRDVFTLVLLSQPTSNVVFAITGLDETEGALSTSEVTFTPENWNIQQTITITGVDDDEVDGDIDYILTIAVVDELSDPAYHGQAETLTVTNIDNDTAEIIISMSGDEISTDESGTSDSFEVMLSSQPTSDVVISISGLDDTEGELDVSQLTFTPSNWDQPQTVTVTGIDDLLMDGDIQYTLTLSVENTLSDAVYHDQETSVVVINADDDIAAINITETDGHTQTTEDGGTDSFTVSLNSQPQEDVVVEISGIDSSEGVLSTTELVFSQQNWDTEQTVTITGVDDDEADGNIDYTLTIAVVNEQSDATYHDQSETLTVTNIDDDSSGIVVTMSGDEITTDESGTSDSFDVRLSSEPASDVVISISGLDDTEGELDVSQLTFTPSNWDQPQTVTVTGEDDFLVDGDIQYTLTLSVENTLSDSDYHDQETSVVVINADDDIAAINITETDGHTQTTEDGGTDSFTVSLNSQPQNHVVIEISGLDSSEGSLSTTELIFSQQNWNIEQTVTITGVDDDQIDGNVEYTLTLTVDFVNSDVTYRNISNSLNVVNIDNDGEEENHAPEPEDDFFEVDQDELLSGTSLILNDSDPDGDQLFINITPLVAPENGTLTIYENGTFDYQPDSGFSGTDTFEYQVCDNQTPPLCASATVSITINPKTIDPNGDTDSDEFEVTRGFSPNADGINDEFRLPWIDDYDRVGIIIFNRWGSVVYENDHYDNSWTGVASSGLAKGKGLPTGTYYYVITIYDANEKLKGYFYLAR